MLDVVAPEAAVEKAPTIQIRLINGKLDLQSNVQVIQALGLLDVAKDALLRQVHGKGGLFHA